MQKLRIMFLGCGFLATHIIPHILPFSEHIILVDRERIEKVNYDNCIYPKAYVGRRKVTALASLIQVLSSVPVTPIHMDIKNAEQLLKIHEEYKPDFVFVTFDNLNARFIAKAYVFLARCPTLFIGVTENYIYIDWASHLVLPRKPEEIERVKRELERVRDVCSRLEFRGLGVMASAYAYYAFTRWIEKREKVGFIISVKDNIEAYMLKR